MIVIFGVNFTGLDILYGIGCDYLYNGYLISFDSTYTRKSRIYRRERRRRGTYIAPRETKGKKGPLNNIRIVLLPFQVIR